MNKLISNAKSAKKAQSNAKLYKILILISLLVTISGCLPIPNRTQVIPKISGQITKNLIPLKGVKLLFYRTKQDKVDANVKIEILTDSKGMYEFKGDKDFHLYVMFGDPISSWSMDIIHNGLTYIGWESFNIGYAQESLTLKCELNYKPPDKNFNQGVCKL